MFLFISILIIIFCTILQGTLLPKIPFYGVIPDLNLIIVTSFACCAGISRGTGFGFFGGFLLDMISLKSMGASSLSKTCTAFLAGNYKKKRVGILLPLLLITINTIINEGIYLLFYFAFDNQKVLPANIITKVAMQISLNLIFSPLFIILFNKLNKMFTPRQILI